MLGDLGLQWIVPVATSNIQNSGQPAYIYLHTSSIWIIIHNHTSSIIFIHFHIETTMICTEPRSPHVLRVCGSLAQIQSSHSFETRCAVNCSFNHLFPREWHSLQSDFSPLQDSKLENCYNKISYYIIIVRKVLANSRKNRILSGLDTDNYNSVNLSLHIEELLIKVLRLFWDVRINQFKVPSRWTKMISDLKDTLQH